MRARTLLALVLAALWVGQPAIAQVSASQAPTPVPLVDHELCPLQLDFDLTQHAHRLHDGPEGATVRTSTASYVCDKARVETITVIKEKDRPRQVLLSVSAITSTKWMRQDINLTVSLLVNGAVQKSEQFRALTIGDPDANWASRNVAFAGSSSKARGLRMWVKRADFDAWFAEGSKPTVRVVLKVVDDGEDED